MSISAQMLREWSRKGSHDGLVDTHLAVRHALSQRLWGSGFRYRFYHQGSYSSRTYVRAGSDVDMVVELTEPTLPELVLGDSRQPDVYRQFRREALAGLKSAVGKGGIRGVHVGRKALHIATDYLDADVIVAWQLPLSESTSAAVFWPNGAEPIVSYPWQHRTAIKEKSRRANGLKPTVRMFKNTKAKIASVHGTRAVFAPSYYIESLIWNAPDACLTRGPETMFTATLAWLNDRVHLANLSMPHGFQPLIGDSNTQWSSADAREFIATVNRL